MILLLGGANHDPEQFAHPDQLDITRGSKRHLSFGRGIHHCLGAPLARMEGQVAFERLLARYETIRLASDPRFKDQIVLRGVEALPVDSDAGAGERGRSRLARRSARRARGR